MSRRGVIKAEIAHPSTKDLLDAILSDSKFDLVQTVMPKFPLVPIVAPHADGVFPRIGERFKQKLLDSPPTVTINVTGRAGSVLDSKKLLKMIADIRPPLSERILEMQRMETYRSLGYPVSKAYSLDAAPLDEVRVNDLLDRMESTIGQMLFECAHPAEDAVSDDIQRRLAQVLRLVWWHETIDNGMYDLELREAGYTLRGVEERLRGHDRHHSIIRNMVERMRGEIERARALERELRAELVDDSGDRRFDPNFFEAVVQAAFDAALRLEANFEARLFPEDAEAA